MSAYDGFENLTPDQRFALYEMLGPTPKEERRAYAWMAAYVAIIVGSAVIIGWQASVAAILSAHVASKVVYAFGDSKLAEARRRREFIDRHVRGQG